MRNSVNVSYPCCCSMHLPCTHGWGAQWSVPERHRGPWVLGGHRQWNPLILSTQVPPLIHGFELHSLISTSHLAPIRVQLRESTVWNTLNISKTFYFTFSCFFSQQVTYTCISWGAHTFVLVDAILALAILTGTASTVIFIDLTIHPWEKLNHKFTS